jgi:hypothetical protein
MSTIIAGLFGNLADAEGAVAKLEHAGVAAEHLTSFVVNSPGQHGTYPIGGDRHQSPGAKHAEGGSVKGAVAGGVAGAIAGAAAVPVVGPLAVPVAASVGAYTGSLVGALNGTEDGPKREQEYLRTAGTMVAVNASVSDVASETIARIMKECNAVEVEHAEGTWADGTWSDFNPLSVPHRVDEPPPVPATRTSPPPAS